MWRWLSVFEAGSARTGSAALVPREAGAGTRNAFLVGTASSSRRGTQRGASHDGVRPDDGELLAEGQVLDHQMGSRAHGREERRQEGNEEAEHRAGEGPGPGRDRQWFKRGRSIGDRQGSRARDGHEPLCQSNEKRYIASVKSSFQPTSAAALVDLLAASGRYHFTTADAVEALGVSPVAARAALRRLTAKGAIASPHRGFHVIVPPEYRRLGCLPAEQFVPQLMAHLGVDYYAGLLTAAQFHGAAHQRPQAFQVMVERNRAAIECGEVRVDFFARKAIARVSVAQVNTPRGVLRLSSPEATALDLVGYERRAGGLDTVANVLAELAERLDPVKLAAAAGAAPTTWAQRLGYLLDLAGATDKTEGLAKWVQARATEDARLISGRRRGRQRSRRWRLVVNAKVEIET